MRVAGRKGYGQRPGRLRRLVRRQLRRTVTGVGVLALAVPLAWPSGAAGQHLAVPSASSVRTEMVRLADFVTGNGSPAPTVPVQQAGTAAGVRQRVPAAQTAGLKHTTGHAAGAGKGQLPAWPGAHGPGGSAKGTFTAGGAARGFDPATSTLVAADTTAQSDTYQNADGSLTRKVWSTPVNYQTASGSWAPLDDTLVRGTSGRWQAKANALTVSFAAAGSDKTLSTVAVPDGSEQVSFALSGAGNVAATASGSSVTYPGILPSTDATETALPNGMSESLILNSATAGTTWTFPLTLKGLTASVDGNTVELTDASGKVVGDIPPATATSGPVNLADPGAQASSTLTYQLGTLNGAPALQMTLDPAWLNAPGRVFPVTVDPTVNFDTQGTTFTQAENGTPQTGNNSGATLMRSGTITTSNTYSDIGLVGFSAIGTSYPNAHLTSASMKLFNAYASQCTSSASVSAYQVTSSWSPSTSLTYPGPSYGTLDAQWTGTAAADACANTSGLLGKGGWLTLPFNSAGVSLLNQWTSGSGSNWGFAVVTSQSNANYWKYFDTYNDGSVAGTQGGDCVGDCRPYLQLTYSTTASDIPPQVNSQYPANNYNSPTLTPELMASGSDADNWPFSALQYNFSVYNSSGTQLANSGNIATPDWTVPAGLLSWGQTYGWTVQAYDGASYSAPPPAANSFSTPVPQPLVTSQLAQNPAGPGFNPQTGNWTTSATDAQVATAGPALEIVRDYNSADPRLSGAFGAGWSSVLDMKVSPGESGGAGTATQVVTYPDGEEVAFGLNANGTYSPPPGRFATLASVTGGFTLTDKNDTVYTFTQAAGTGVYAITSIEDALGRTETFTYNGSGQVTTVTAASGRTLTVNWTTPSGAAYSHVSSVVTNPATAGNSSTAQTWGYSYSGDSLSSACPPASATVCTAYTYTAGSDYPSAVLDSGPQSYWRLDETSGTQANSSVLANEGSDVAAYYQVTQGTDAGPLPGSAAKAATLNGTSSYVVLPSKLVSGADYQSVSLWFKTSSPNGVLFSYQAQQIFNGSTTGRNAPTIYIGTDGKLNAEYWNGTAAPITTPAAVDDGNWHLVTLSSSGNSQTLYLDGAQVGSPLSGAISTAGMADNYVGTGYIGNSWPDETNQGSTTAYPEYFHGDISDVGFWTRNLTATEVKAMYTAGSHPAALLTKLTQPSGSVIRPGQLRPADRPGDQRHRQQRRHLAAAGAHCLRVQPGLRRVGLRRPAAGLLAAQRHRRYLGQRLGELLRLRAARGLLQRQRGRDRRRPVHRLAGRRVRRHQRLPQHPDRRHRLQQPRHGRHVVRDHRHQPGALLRGNRAGHRQRAVRLRPSALHRQRRQAQRRVLRRQHQHRGFLGRRQRRQVALRGARGRERQPVPLPGREPAGHHLRQPQHRGLDQRRGRAGFLGGSWPDTGSSTVTAKYFNGDLAELAWYPYQLAAWQVSYQWNAAQQAKGLTPVQTSTVTDPLGKTLTYTYDLLNGGRELSQTDADGGTTSYGYDSAGFQDSVTDPDGHQVLTGHDPRGNVVSKTTCQNQSAGQCSTSYWTYWPDDTSAQLTTADPRNDMVQTASDGRSASSSDTTYQTSYAYNAAGEVTGVTTPPVTGFPSGRTTSYTYTDGTTSTGGYQGAVPPKGLPYQETTPGGAVTTTLYYANGDAAQVTDPDGQRTVYTYDGLGRKISEVAYSDTYPSGLTTSYTYDANGDLATETDPAVADAVTGATHTAKTTTTYDADGDVLTQVTADLTGGDASRTVTKAYNGYDQLITQTDAAGAVTHYTYDPYGNLATETDPDGNVTQYGYDYEGHLTSTTLQNYTGSPPGSQTAANLVEEARTYDPAGRLATVTDAMGRATHYSYTDNDLLAGIDVTPGPTDWSQDFTTEWYSYDGAGNKTEEWSNNGETDTTYSVDAADRETGEVLDPSGLDRTTAIAYTPDDKPSSVTQSGSGSATRTTSYTYDPAGNVLTQSVTDPGSGGPVAWYNLSQSSGTAVPDWITGGQPATASGVTWDSSEGTFSGTSGSQVTTNGPVLDTTGSFTVAGWVNLAVNNLGHLQAVASQAAGTANGFTLGFDQASGDWQFGRSLTDTASPSVAAANSSAAAATGTWTFLAGTYNGSTGTMSLYVNGTSSGSATDPTPVAAHGAFTIGSAKTGGAQGDWFDGQAADIQVYPRALSAAEVQTLYGTSNDITTSTLTTSWTRDQRGLPTAMTNPDGAVTDYTYDQAGQLTSTTAPTEVTQVYGGSLVSAHPVTLTGYNTFGETTETKDPVGDITSYGYDGDGRQVSRTLPAYTPPGGSQLTPIDTTAYDGDGRTTATTDGLNYTTHYTYDQLGDQVTETDPDNSVTTTAYDNDGEPLSVTSPTGAVSQTTYDYLGRQQTSTQIERYTGSGTTAYTAHYSYGDTDGAGGGGGWLSQVTSPDGVSTSYTYNPAQQKTTVTDGAGDATSYAYDALGEQTKVTYPDGTATATGYDGAGNPVSTTSLSSSGSTLASTAVAYDGEGDQLSSTDAAGNNTTFTYNLAGLVTQEVQPVTATSAISTSFGYDAAGNQTLYTDGKGSQWWDTFNSWGLEESRVEPYTTAYTTAANSTFTTAYDADQRPVTLTEPGAVTVTSTYNNVGELTGQSGSGADAPTATRTFGYDTAGNLTSAATSNTLGTGSNATSETFTYNDRSEVLTASGSAGSTTIGYNGDGQTASVADAAGTTSYTYDSAGRLATLANPVTGTTATYSYNPDSLVSGISYGSGNDTQSFGYDGMRRLTSDTLKTSSGTSVASIAYGYNADSQITSENTTGLAGAAANTYTYDQAGRLTSWNNGTTNTAYGYDADSNLTTSGSKTYTYDARDEMTGDGTGTYAYTARGTPVSEPGPSGTTLATTFDAYGDQATAGARAYGYDALGRLTGDTLSGSGYAFSYVGSSGAMASDGSSTYAWDPSGSVLAGTGTVGGGTSGSLALTDIHDNLIGQFTAASTTLPASKAYDPWGNAVAGSVSGLLGYQSAWSDGATAKDLMGARWYDPSAGDFTSADSVQVDPVPDSAAGNPFAYAADNPLEGMDPSGHMVVGLPGDEKTPAETARVISSSQQASVAAGTLRQEQAKAKALAAAAAKNKSAAAIKAAAAAAAAAKSAAAKLQVANAAKAAAAKAQVAAAKVADARAVAAAQKAAALSTRTAKQKQLDQQADARGPVDGSSSSKGGSSVCPHLATNCQACQSADATNCYNLNLNLNKDFFAGSSKSSDSGSDGIQCKLVWTDDSYSEACGSNVRASADEGSSSGDGSGDGESSGLPPVGGGSNGPTPRVIGHIGDYEKLAAELGARSFDIPDDKLASMTEEELWEADLKFLDRGAAVGAKFILGTPLNQARAGSLYLDEIDYLEQEHGYEYNSARNALIPNGYRGP